MWDTAFFLAHPEGLEYQTCVSKLDGISKVSLRRI